MIEIIITAAKAVGIAPSLLFGICMAESSLKSGAIGDKGKSFGLCQVQIRTAKHMDSRFQKDKEIQKKIDRLKNMCRLSPDVEPKDGTCSSIPTVDDIYKGYLLDPQINAEVAAKYIKYQIKRHDNTDFRNIECRLPEKRKKLRECIEKYKTKAYRCAISAYNAGRCIKSNQKTYVNRVLRIAKQKEFLDE